MPDFCFAVVVVVFNPKGFCDPSGQRSSGCRKIPFFFFFFPRGLGHEALVLDRVQGKIEPPELVASSCMNFDLPAPV